MPPDAELATDVNLDLNLIPEGVCDDLCRVVFKEVRDFSSNMTSEQKEDFERWKIEYRRRKSLKGGEIP